jgi:exopolyphosphatase / guanosine-5'-triphosphate,3'-diphosphate pyrophosphatase
VKIAALDLGSNTFLCLICEVLDGQITRIDADEIEFVRLAEGMQKIDAGSPFKKITPEAFNRAETAFQKFQELINKHKPEHILAMGTSATRDAVNKDQLIKLGLKYGIPVEAIPGEKEAAITSQGTLSHRTSLVENEKILVVDIGGGSTEFILNAARGKIFELALARSYDIGCVRIKEKYELDLPVEESRFLDAEEYIQSKLNDFTMQNIQELSNLSEIIAVAGTPTTLAMAQLKTKDITQAEGFQLTEQHLNNWLIKAKRAKVQDLIDAGIPAGRADVILVGIMTLLLTLKKFNKTSLTVSTRGVRHGIALLVYQRYN